MNELTVPALLAREDEANERLRDLWGKWDVPPKERQKELLDIREFQAETRRMWMEISPEDVVIDNGDKEGEDLTFEDLRLRVALVYEKEFVSWLAKRDAGKIDKLDLFHMWLGEQLMDGRSELVEKWLRDRGDEE